MVAALKLVHVATIALWAGGLLLLPFLAAFRTRDLDGPALHDLHRTVRFVYVGLVSPAAFLAIGSGTALVIAAPPLSAWFSVKLLLVAMLVLAHVIVGLSILKVFDKGARYSRLRLALSVTTSGTLSLLIVALVLGKPDLAVTGWPADWFRPGALGNALAPIIDEAI